MASNSITSPLITVGLVFFLTACDSDKSSDGVIDLPGLAVYGLDGVPADQIFNPWLATIRSSRIVSNPGNGNATISTIQYSDSRTFQDHIDFYSASNEPGNVPYVSAGQELLINAPSGLWYNIAQGEVGKYEVTYRLPDTIPTGATLSIPGNIFPSVEAFPILEPLAPIRILPMSGLISVDDEYKWQPVGGPGAYMHISILELDSSGDLVDFRIGCDVIDDGEFELPLDALNIIDSSQASSFEVRYTRRFRRIDLFEGVAIYSRISVAE